MSHAKNCPQPGEGPSGLPEVPPDGSAMAEITRITVKGLQEIYDKVVASTVTPDIGRRDMRQYLTVIFDKFNLYGTHNLADSLRSWNENIEDSERRTQTAQREGARRAAGSGWNLPRLPGFEELIAGLSIMAPGRVARGRGAPVPAGGATQPPPVPS